MINYILTADVDNDWRHGDRDVCQLRSWDLLSCGSLGLHDMCRRHLLRSFSSFLRLLPLDLVLCIWGGRLHELRSGNLSARTRFNELLRLCCWFLRSCCLNSLFRMRHDYLLGR